MEEILKTLLVALVPAIATGLISYFGARSAAKTQIDTVIQNNKHEIDKLIKQNEVDIKSLEEKHRLEMERAKQEHQQKIELMELEHKNLLEARQKEQNDAVMYGLMGDVIKDPKKLESFMDLANNPMFKKKN